LDVTVNLNEETRDGARIAARRHCGVVIVLRTLVGFMRSRFSYSATRDRSAGISIVFAVAEKLLPDPGIMSR
jgi:hypothetical protein